MTFFVVHLKIELILARKIEIGIIEFLEIYTINWLNKYLYIVDRLKHLGAFFTSLFLSIGISCHGNEKKKHLRHLRQYSDHRIKKHRNFLNKMHLCWCAIQVLRDAFSSTVYVSITPMAAFPKLIPSIVDSEYNFSIRGRCKFSSSIKYRFYCTFHVNWRV